MHKYYNTKKEPLINSSYFNERLSPEECEKLNSLHSDVVHALLERQEEFEACLLFHKYLLDKLLQLTPKNIHRFFDQSTFGYTDHPERLLNELLYNDQGGVSYSGNTLRFNLRLSSFSFFTSSTPASTSTSDEPDQPYKLFG